MVWFKLACVPCAASHTSAVETSTDDVVEIEDLKQEPSVAGVHHADERVEESGVHPTSEPQPPHYDDAVAPPTIAMASPTDAVVVEGAVTNAAVNQHEHEAVDHKLIVSPESRVSLADEKHPDSIINGLFFFCNS